MKFSKIWWANKLAKTIHKFYKFGVVDIDSYFELEYPKCLYTPWDEVPAGQVVHITNNVCGVVVGRCEDEGIFEGWWRVCCGEIDTVVWPPFLRSIPRSNALANFGVEVPA